MSAKAIKAVWDTESDPNNHGWIVMTASAGWQPPLSRVSRDASDDEVAEMAYETIKYHDGQPPCLAADVDITR